MTNLLIISHTPHYLQDGRVVGWGPTVREIDNFSRLFERIIHLAVMYPGSAPLSSLFYQADNIEFVPVPPAGGEFFTDKLTVLKSYPGYLRTIHETINRLQPTDVIHVRCPANISLLSLLYLSLRKQPSRRWIKYAGNWSPTGKDFWSYRFQRWISRQNWTGGLVTVNGSWSNQPAHVYSFLNPCIDLNEYEHAIRLGEKKIINSPLELLFIGGLEEQKGVMRCLEITEKLILKNIQVNLTLVGDGPLREKCAAWAADHGLKNRVRFVGWLPRDALAEFYSKAHILVFPSQSEGWPKVLSEAMAYGVVPVASEVSSIPQILAEFKVGRSLPFMDVEAFVDAIQDYLSNPERWKQESQAGIEAARNFTYDVYLGRLKNLFKNTWGLELPEI